MNSTNIHISIVSPVYKAESIVHKLVEEISKHVLPITDNYEIILVEDGGPDKSWERIEEICETNKKVKGVKLSRNFGQHYAIAAGLEMSKGEWVIVMDCDLQDRPDQIPLLYNKAMEGYDLVIGRRIMRQDGMLKRLSSRFFYAVFSYLTETKQDGTTANFGIYNRKVITSVIEMGDRIRVFPILIRWVGFDKAFLDIKHGSRHEGISSYSFGSLISLGVGIMISFSNKPLKLIIKLGFFISIVSLILSFYYLFMYLSGKVTISGYTSLILSIWLLSGVIILTLGVIGRYISEIFESVKKRPLFLIDDIINSRNLTLPLEHEDKFKVKKKEY